MKHKGLILITVIAALTGHSTLAIIGVIGYIIILAFEEDKDE